MPGDYAKLDRLIGTFKRLATDQAARSLTKAIAEEAQEQLDEGFARGRDPYGQAWKPPKLRAGQPLRHKGRLQRSFTTKLVGTTSFVQGSNVFYAPVHQHGAVIEPKKAHRIRITRRKNKKGEVKTKVKDLGAHKFLKFRGPKGWYIARRVRIPARRMIPEGGVMPPIWRRAFADAARAWMRAQFGKGR